jgi:alcohol dehydrogenase (cytochrome c)
MGSKDGLYGIDRNTRTLLFKTPVTTLKNIDIPFTEAGVDVCPGTLGGVEWNGAAFDPRRSLL